jgi:hemoglobin
MPSLPIVPAPDAPGGRPADPEKAGDAAPGGEGRPDLTDEGIEAVLVAFYDTVMRDPLLAPYFAVVDMPAHIPRIADFWSTMLFQTRRYSGNAFRPHLEMPGLTAAHFARWVETLEATVDARHAGPAADRMKDLAHRVAYSMQLRLGITPFAPFAPFVSYPSSPEP